MQTNDVRKTCENCEYFQKDAITQLSLFPGDEKVNCYCKMKNKITSKNKTCILFAKKVQNSAHISGQKS